MGSLGLARGNPAALHQHGQKLYQQGRLDAAIEAFTEALKFKDVDLLNVLDSRAGTYSKLAQYDRALRDGRQMIKAGKQDERGYLRLAKTLILDGKPEKAVEIYAYGLKNLPSNHPRRQLIEQLHEKLQGKIAPKCLDPFTVLPLEIARMVLVHFDFKQIVAILRVSKQWDRFLSSLRDLWMRIDLSGARMRIHWTSVRAYIRRSRTMLTSAVVKNISTPSNKRVLEFFSRCPYLESLEIWTPSECQTLYELFKTSRRLKYLMIAEDTPVSQDYITKFLTSLPHLERIEIRKAKSSPETKVQWPSKLPHLRSINLTTVESSRPNGHISALYIPRQENPSTPYSLANLEDLHLTSNPDVFIPYPPTFNPFELPRLRSLDLSGVYIGEEFALPPSLGYLRIRGGAGADEFPFSNNDPFQLPNLHTLILSDVPWVTNSTMLVFLEAAKSSLRVLHVDSCFRLHGLPFLKAICDLNPRVTELNLSHIAGISDAATDLIVGQMSTLKMLNLSFTEITGVAIKKLADARSLENGGAKVDRVYTRGCEYVSPDAVTYGRSKGLEVFV